MPQSTRLKPFVFALLALGNGVASAAEFDAAGYHEQ